MISKTYNIDCVEYMKTISDKFFELAVCDPPYGIGINKTQLGNGKKKIFRGSSDWDSKIPNKEYFTELFRVSKNQIIWGGNYFTEYLRPTGAWLFWDKGTGENDFADGELGWTSFNGTLRKITKSWVGANAKDESTRIHPTQKPIGIYKWILRKYAKPGDRIFDSHMGSQSSRIAVHEMGFDYYGCEIDPDYFRDGNKRFEVLKKRPIVFFQPSVETNRRSPKRFF